MDNKANVNSHPADGHVVASTGQRLDDQHFSHIDFFIRINQFDVITRKHAIFIFNVLNIITSVGSPYLVYQATKPFENQDSSDNVDGLYYLLAYTLVLSLNNFFYRYRGYLTNKKSATIAENFSRELFECSLELPFSEVGLEKDNNRLTEISSRLERLRMTVEYYLNVIYYCPPALLEIAAYIVIMSVTYEWQYCIFLLGISMAQGLAYFLTKKYTRVTEKSDEYENVHSSSTTKVCELLEKHSSTIKANNAKNWVTTIVTKKFERSKNTYNHYQSASFISLTTQDIVKNIFLCANLLYAFYQLKSGDKELSDFSFIASILHGTFNCVSTIATCLEGTNVQIQTLLILLNAVDHYPREKNYWLGNDQLELKHAPDIVFDELSWNTAKIPVDMSVGRTPLPEGKMAMMDQKSEGDKVPYSLTIDKLELKPNTITAFIGESGAGKSSLVQLLSGYDKNYQGEILIDGKEIKSLSLPSLRSHIAFVPQTVDVLEGYTVYENIALAENTGNSDDVREMKRILKMVSLDMKYYEVVGKLSGGEEQRIGLARCLFKLYKNQAKIIIFDESTSSLDNLTQRKIIDIIRELKRDATIIMIAHRLETINVADHVVFFYKEDSVGKIKTGSLAEIKSFDKAGKFFIEIQGLSSGNELDLHRFFSVSSDVNAGSASVSQQVETHLGLTA